MPNTVVPVALFQEMIRLLEQAKNIGRYDLANVLWAILGKYAQDHPGLLFVGLESEYPEERDTETLSSLDDESFYREVYMDLFYIAPKSSDDWGSCIPVPLLRREVALALYGRVDETRERLVHARRVREANETETASLIDEVRNCLTSLGLTRSALSDILSEVLNEEAFAQEQWEDVIGTAADIFPQG